MSAARVIICCLLVAAVNAGIELDIISSVFIPGDYDESGNGQYGLDSGALEQIAVDTHDGLVYAIGDKFVHVIDISNVKDMSIIHKEEITGVEMTDIIICGSYIFVARDNKVDKLNGDVAIYNKFNKETKTLTMKTSIQVGSLPDMLKASKNCSVIVVALEGEPFVANGVLNDPEGGVAIISYNDIFDSFSSKLLNFRHFDSSAEELIAAGVRKSNPNSLFSADLEPEYVDFNEDYSIAYICLQENNAIAEVDLVNEVITKIYPLGFKDWKKLGLDTSDKDGGVNMMRWPVYGMYMPDAIHHVNSNGFGYVITANEGDEREYDEDVDTAHGGFNDAMKGKALLESGRQFDMPQALLHAMGDDKKLGRMKFSTVNGVNSEGAMTKLYTFGGRGFSIIRTDTMEMVFDSGRQLEDAIADKYSHLFNSEQSSDETLAATKDTRSDNKGPEAEGLEVADVFGKHLVFVGIERPGLIAIFSYKDDILKIKMESIWANIPNKPNSKWGDLFDARQLSAVEPEDMKFVPASESPNGKPLLLVAGNMCGSLSALEIKDGKGKRSRHASHH